MWVYCEYCHYPLNNCFDGTKETWKGEALWFTCFCGAESLYSPEGILISCTKVFV